MADLSILGKIQSPDFVLIFKNDASPARNQSTAIKNPVTDQLELVGFYRDKLIDNLQKAKHEITPELRYDATKAANVFVKHNERLLAQEFTPAEIRKQDGIMELFKGPADISKGRKRIIGSSLGSAMHSPTEVYNAGIRIFESDPNLGHKDIIREAMKTTFQDIGGIAVRQSIRVQKEQVSQQGIQERKNNKINVFSKKGAMLK